MNELDTTIHNAEYAEREFGLDKQTFIELSERFARSIKHGDIIGYNSNLASKVDTAFAVGLIVGSLINKDDKKIQKILQ